MGLLIGMIAALILALAGMTWLTILVIRGPDHHGRGHNPRRRHHTTRTK